MPVNDDSLEPYEVTGDELFGEYSELSPVDWLEPLPRLLPVCSWFREVQFVVCVTGSGGGIPCWGLGWLALLDRLDCTG